jgi:hypothetical protein
MLNWQELSQQLRQIVNTVIQFAKARRREEAAIGLAAILFWLGPSLINWLPKELQDFVKYWHGNLIITGVFYSVGLVFLGYGIFRIWKLTYIPNLSTPTNRPSAIKGPRAFTPDDGELFRKLGREEELRKLLGYIQDDQVSLVVLMGASGVGKTSLLRAGLTDILKDKGINYHYWEAKSSNPRQSLLLAIQQSWPSALSGSTDGSNPAQEPPASLDGLVNVPLELGKHVIVLDQFEQLGTAMNGPLFRHLSKVARSARPPHRVTWVIAFRREYRASWSDFIIPEQERKFFPPELSLRLFTSQQARNVISQLIQAANLSVEQKVIDNLIDAATVDGEVSSVDIGIGLLVLSELHERQGENILTEDTYHFAGGAEGLLTQYINRCLDNFPAEHRKNLLSAMLALSDETTGQRVAEGKTATELAAEIKAENALRLKIELERLTQRDIRLLEHVDTPEGEEIRYRLPHERLIPAISRIDGKLSGERTKAKQKLVDAFSAWKNSHTSQYLLKGRDLRLVEQYQSQILWGTDEPEKLKFLQRSKRRRTVRQLISVMLVVSLVAGGWLGKRQYQRYEAMKYRYEAMRFLRENNYPPELYDYQHQLKSLELTEGFNLQYLPFLGSDTLEELTITAKASTNSLEGLIDSLTRCPRLNKLTLDLRDTLVKEVPSFPNSLTELSLDLRSTSSNSIGKLSSFPSSLQKLSLNLHGSAVKEIPPFPNSLTELSLNLGSKQVKVPPFPNSLTELSLDLYDIGQAQEVPPFPSSLQKLSLRLTGKQVKLAPFPNSLTELTVYLMGNQVKEMPPFPKSLQKLTVYILGSQVKELPPFPNSLTELTVYIVTYGMKELPPFPNSLTELTVYLRGFQAQEVPPFPKSLQKLTLDLNESSAKEVPTLPNSLTKLLIALGNNQVKAPIFPNSLTELSLDFSGSEAQEVWPFPNSLQKLSLSLGKKQLKVPQFPSSLTELLLDFRYSQAKEVPTLPNSLTELSLDFSHSEVQEVPPLPNSLQKLSLNLSDSQVKEIPPVQQLNCQTLNLNFSPDMRRSLKTLPRSVIHLKL